MPVKQYKRQVNKKQGDHKQAQWSDKQKYEAVATYLILGSLRGTAMQLGIPELTIRKWHISDWWPEYELEIRNTARAQTTGKLRSITERAMKIVEDRLEQGDLIYDQKTGKLVRKPVGAHVANKILNDSFDRQILLEKLQREEKKEVKQEEIQNTLLRLQSEFSRFAKAKTIEGELAETKGGDPASQASLPAPDVQESPILEIKEHETVG